MRNDWIYRAGYRDGYMKTGRDHSLYANNKERRTYHQAYSAGQSSRDRQNYLDNSRRARAIVDTVLAMRDCERKGYDVVNKETYYMVVDLLKKAGYKDLGDWSSTRGVHSHSMVGKMGLSVEYNAGNGRLSFYALDREPAHVPDDTPFRDTVRHIVWMTYVGLSVNIIPETVGANEMDKIFKAALAAIVCPSCGDDLLDYDTVEGTVDCDTCGYHDGLTTHNACPKCGNAVKDMLINSPDDYDLYCSACGHTYPMTW